PSPPPGPPTCPTTSPAGTGASRPRRRGSTRSTRPTAAATTGPSAPRARPGRSSLTGLIRQAGQPDLHENLPGRGNRHRDHARRPSFPGPARADSAQSGTGLRATVLRLIGKSILYSLRVILRAGVIEAPPERAPAGATPSRKR